MTAFALSSGGIVNFDSLTGAAGNDVFTLTNGTQLRVDTDTRYCANHSATTGNVGGVTILGSALGSFYIDGTNVRVIPYTGGGGNVPAIGAAITEGGVSASLLGVWSALNAPPTAAGAAMPASGWIKVKNKTGGNFAAGALSGITATASGPDVVGWIEVVGVEGTVLGLNGDLTRTGSVTMQGAWWQVGSTSGAANQTFQLPASLANTFYPGLFIETAAGSGIYEFWPNVNGLSPATLAADERGKVCWIGTQGKAYLGGNGTTAGGMKPSAGRNIQVPNIVLLSCTSAAPTANTVPAALSATRKTINTRSGNISLNTVNYCWNGIFAVHGDLTVTNCGFLDRFSSDSARGAVVVNGGGVGVTTSAQLQLYAFAITNNLLSPAVSNFNCVAYANYGTVAYVSGTAGLSLTNVKGQLLVARGGVTVKAIDVANSTNFSLSGCTGIGSPITIEPTCSNGSVVNSFYCDTLLGNAGASSSQVSAIQIGGTNITVDGLSWATATANACAPQVSLVGSSGQITNSVIRNLGSYAAPLNGCAALGGVVSLGTSTAVAQGCVVERAYVTNTAGSLVDGNGYLASGLTFQNVMVDVAMSSGAFLYGQDTVYKGIFGVAYSGDFGAVGTAFIDGWVSATAGYLAIIPNRNSARTTNYVVNSGTENVILPGNGDLYPRIAGEQVTWTMPYFILGHSSIGGSVAIEGTYTAGNHTLQYDVDTGAGFSGTWKSPATVTAVPNPTTVGCRVMFRWTVGANNSDLVTMITLATVTDATTQQAQYPLNTIQLGVSGAVAGSSLAVYNPGATLAGTTTVTAGTEAVAVANNTTGAVTGSLRLRAYGYLELLAAWSATSGTNYAPVAQIADPVNQLSPAAAAALSGLSINWASSTVTLTGTRSIREIYDWCKVQIAANPTQANFLTSTDGVNFTSSFNLVINGGTLTGTGSLNLGGNTFTLTGAGSVSAALPVTSGAGTYTALTLTNVQPGSEVRLYNASGNEMAGGVETLSGSTLSFFYTTVTAVSAYVVVILPGFKFYRLPVALGTAAQSQTVYQQTDSAYQQS